MKKKIENNKRRNTAVLILSVILIICGIFCTATMVFPAQSVVGQGGSPVAGINDADVNINVASRDEGDYIVKTYSFTLNESNGDPNAASIKLGTQLETEDYIYTYGYHWPSQTEVPAAKDVPGYYDDVENNDLDGWVKITDNVGWGVAVKNRDKSGYENIYAVIEGGKVTYMSNCFANCKELLEAPILPNYTANASNAFLNCSKLTKVVLPSSGNNIMNTISPYMFSGCSALQHMYIPENITNISEQNPFLGCTSLILYAAAEEMPSEWTGEWNIVDAYNSVVIHYGKTVADYCMTNETTL